jgi:hypothetical protein
MKPRFLAKNLPIWLRLVALIANIPILLEESIVLAFVLFNYGKEIFLMRIR